MKLAEIKQIASERSIRVGGLKKVDIIRTIQQQEGNTPCFSTGKAKECGQADCLWMSVCE